MQTIINGKAFLQALNFHKEGLAAVQDASGWYHVNVLAEAAYSQRYERAFGYYEERAAVTQSDNCFHINTTGERVYAENYAWVGNFQEGCCTVRNYDDQYFHINTNGKPIYTEKYAYAGDFREGFAVVRLANSGLYAHINRQGERLNRLTFDDLGVFHKGIAIAKDLAGWHHIHPLGKSLYLQRFSQVEPFYNGFALVESFDGDKMIIDEQGNTILVL